jgi:Ala-tRNA(Pro) deacylase
MATIHFIMGHEGLPLNRFAGTSWTEIPKRLINYLNENKVRYEILHQPKDWSTRKPQPRTARFYTQVFIVRAGQQHLVAVLPTNARIDLKGFAEVGEPIRLETEEEFKWLFPDCAVGAIPPFGNLYGLPTFADNALSKNDYIIFAAGTDNDHIKISYATYERIVQPRIGSFSVKVDARRSE